MKRIAVICERDRAYGRGLCLGIAGAAAREKDWSLEFVDDLPVVKSTRLAGFDGVIARISNNDIAAALKPTGLPVVDVYSTRIRPEFGSIDGDQPGIGRLAAEFLISRRYRNFAYCGYDGIGYSDARRDSFVATLSESGFPCNVFLTPRDAVNEFGTVITSREIVGLGHDSSALSAWLKALPAQTAVFCCHDVRAWQVLAICRAEGIAVPRRLAVLGVDNDELVCSFTSPTLSSIDNSAMRIGEAAVGLLSRMLRSPKFRKRTQHIVVGPRGVCERGSTAVRSVDVGWVSDIMEYISRNVERGIRVDEVIAYAKRPAAVVERGVKDVTGNTVQHHILWTRLETATGQTYGGGTLVAEGTLKPGLSLLDDVSIFGAANSTMTVTEGAQFMDDVFCLGETAYLDWVIAGDGPDGTGAIRSTARTPGRNNAEVAWGRSLTLMGDATIGSDEYAFDFIAPNYVTFPVTLNGHALTLTSARPMNERQYPFFLASSLKGTDAGTIVVGDNLCFYPFKLDASALPEVTLVVSANAEYRTDTDSNGRDLTVSNLVYRSESTISQINRTTTVLGTYTPTSVTSAPKVQLGDAEHLVVGLDLSERTTEFDVAFGGGFAFTEGSCVKVNLGTRRRRQSERLVAWTEKPVGVTFTGETMRDRFIVRDDGLYVVRGTLIIVR